jgi:hypothetical protein
MTEQQTEQSTSIQDQRKEDQRKEDQRKKITITIYDDEITCVLHTPTKTGGKRIAVSSNVTFFDDDKKIKFDALVTYFSARTASLVRNFWNNPEQYIDPES